MEAKKDSKNPAINANEANALFAADRKKSDREISAEDETKLKAHAELKFESNGKSQHMPAGEVYVTPVDQVRIFLKKGYGKIVD